MYQLRLQDGGTVMKWVVFLIVGLLVTCLGALFTVIFWIMRRDMGMEPVFISGGFVLIGAAIAGLAGFKMIKEKERLSYLKKHGRKVGARMVELKENHYDREGYASIAYEIICKWYDPETKTTHKFVSPEVTRDAKFTLDWMRGMHGVNLQYEDSSPYLQFTVLLDPDNYSSYYVDVSTVTVAVADHSTYPVLPDT